MRGLPNGAEGRDQYRTDADENRAGKGVPSESFAENESRKDRIEH